MKDIEGQDWETLVRASWLTAHLTTVGYHLPKKFPASPDILLGKAVPKVPFNKEQWRLAIQEILGKSPPKAKKRRVHKEK